ncbi:hypothetical protein AB0H77_20275 [Streptomyces sp. NPDC050844]|uniref:hypothetical protein n=1 Tax=Streptomyces sp. NPDC050844 TaxID=3155790 RepID=UPI0033E0C068
MTSVQIKPGDIRTRAQLKEIFGGSLQGGIISSRSTPNILLFTDHESGSLYGYQDGWLADEDDLGPVFEYTGEGSVGDQTLTRGNRGIFQHETEGRHLRVFMAVGTVPGTNTKLHRYLGEFELDTTEPYVERQTLDAEQQMRRVLVFRLRPVGEVDQQPDDVIAPADETTATPVPATPSAPIPEPVLELKPATATTSNATAPENNQTMTSTRSAGKAVEVKRREAELSDRFLEFLQAKGHEVTRFRVWIKGQTHPLYTDLYDATDNVLYEAKGTSSRDAVRQAIGQLFDYRRHIEATDARLAVLLPHAPIDDLRDLVESVGFALVYEDGDKFIGWPVAS